MLFPNESLKDNYDYRELFAFDAIIIIIIILDVDTRIKRRTIVNRTLNLSRIQETKAEHPVFK